MAEQLAAAGLTLTVIPRKESGGTAISASKVRQLIKENRMEEMHGLVPESTYSYFISDVGRETAEKIRGCADVVHYLSLIHICSDLRPLLSRPYTGAGKR